MIMVSSILLHILSITSLWSSVGSWNITACSIKKGESQVAGAKLDQLISPSQATETQWAIGPAEDDQMQLRRHPVEQEVERVMNRLGLDQMIIIKDEAAVFWTLVDFVEKR